MNPTVLVAIVATIGNFLQGWDNAAISGAIVYIKQEADLAATLEGLVVAMSLIGATLITTCSGSISDSIGRRPMLIMSSVFYFVSGLVMLWSPNVYVLLVARLLDGFGIGLAVTLVPIYISETAPSDIRGTLNTLPQFTGSGAMFLSYCMIFGMSLLSSPSWRVMLGVLSVPSVLYVALTVFYLPESPRWLVSKGKMLEAKHVLQKLRGREDVSGEMALLVEGLAVGGETSIEEYVIGPEGEFVADQDPIEGRQSSLALASRQGSMVSQKVPLMDPLVTLFGSVHEKLPESGSMIGNIFPRFGSMFSTVDNPPVKDQHSDEESLRIEGEGEDYEDREGEESEDDIRSPLISRQTTSLEKDGNLPLPVSHGSSLVHHESVGSNIGIGGGWQLAWKWSEKEGELKRVYLHQEGVAGTGSRRGSLISLTGESEFVQASALVSQPALYAKELLDQNQIGPAMVHPSETDPKSSVWSALRDPGVKRALMVGIGIQILQQFAGINGVMYYTPQILEQAGVEVLLANLGIGSDSSSFLISAVTMLLELPCIAIAMKLMDTSGRRTLLLTTIPVLTFSLVILVIGNVVNFGTTPHAILSTICVILYFCTFVMGYGPIPNILCSEIFPTRVRGVCIAICCLVYWICDIIVTYTLPVMLTTIGLAGIFGIYCVVCIFSWIFIFLKVPETKGMPLEVITEFFSVGARQTAASKIE